MEGTLVSRQPAKKATKSVRDMKCSVDVCTTSKLKNPELQFFGFPPESQPARLNTWKRACNIPPPYSLPKNCQKNASICQRHFLESDFFAPTIGSEHGHIQLNSIKKIMRKEAVPTKNLNPKIKVSFERLSVPKQDLVSSGIKAYHMPKFTSGPATDCHHCTEFKPDQIIKTKYHCEVCGVKLCLRPCFEAHHHNKSKIKVGSSETSEYINLL